MVDREFLLQAIGGPLRRFILRAYAADSCIASARIGMDLLHRLEIPAFPLAVELTIFNAAFVRRVEREQRMPANKEEVERWFTEDGSHSIGIGVQTRDHPGRHMVLIVDAGLLWDLSADQAARPEKGIDIPNPLIVGVNSGFLTGEDSIYGQDSTGALAIYRARPGYDCWTESPNWDPNGHDAAMRARIVEEAYQGVLEIARRAA